MADLNEKDASQSVKIVGSDGTGLETNAVGASPAGRLNVDVSSGRRLSTSNSTSTPLGIGGVFTGAWEEIIDFADVSVTYISNQDSTVNGASIQWSSDGTNIDASDNFTFLVINGGQQLSFGVKTRYFRIVYTNGGVAQGSFRLQSILHPVHIRTTTHKIGKPIVANDGAELVTSTIQGIASNGNYYTVAVDQEGRLVTSAITGFGSDFAFGDVSTFAIIKTIIRRTVYIEQTSNAQRSIVSNSASDTAAGTGARTVSITYLDSTGAGPFIETITLNGTTPVNTVATNICFIEQMEVLTAGTTLSNVGIISLKAATAGGGVTIGTMAATDNQTFWAHHYIPIGKICNITGISCGHNGTTVGSGGVFTVFARLIGVTNAIERQISDFVRLYGQSSTFARSYTSPIKVSGPARLFAYVLPETSSSTIYRCSVDFFEP